MVSKDQSIGGIICLVCVVVGVLYTLGLFWFGIPLGDSSASPSVPAWTLQFSLVAIPVFLAFIAILGIGAWIGWTMATTPPPKPIEEITSEMEKEQKESAVEEKPKVEEQPTVEERAPEPPKTEEEKKPERKRRT